MVSSFQKKILLFVVVAVVAVSLVVVFFNLFLGEDYSNIVADPENDVFLSVGDSVPSFVDLKSASLDFLDNSLVVNYITKGDLPTLDEDQFLDVDMLIILEDENGLFGSYEFQVNVNSTGRFSTLIDLKSGEGSVHPVVFDKNNFSSSIDVDGLAVPFSVDWNVSLNYEQLSNDEVSVIAFDYLPDEGLHTTYFGIEET